MMRQTLFNQQARWARPGGRRAEDDWITVTTAAPCAICGASAGCAALGDERFVRCARRPSEWPMTIGGWLHRLAQEPLGEAAAIADDGGSGAAETYAGPTAPRGPREPVSAPYTAPAAEP